MGEPLEAGGLYRSICQDNVFLVLWFGSHSWFYNINYYLALDKIYNLQRIIFSGNAKKPRYIKNPYHFPIGHLACSKLVFNFIKQPHLLHCSVRGLKNSHVLHMANLDSFNSSADLGIFGFNRSQGLTSRSLSILAIIHYKPGY